MTRLNQFIIISFLICLGVFAANSHTLADNPKSQDATKTTKSEKPKTEDLMLPKQYYEWVFIGTAHQDDDIAPRFHVTYIDDKSFKAFKETGEFPVGTIILRETTPSRYIETEERTGNIMGDQTISRLHIKDEYAGAGTWSFYSWKPETGQATYIDRKKANCYSCHEKHAAHDQVFTQFYPVMRKILQDRGSEQTGSGE
ncbi:cytochrome P460 family protein [Kordiimonas sp. SCSIO 12610]|uniref:cytochrome P460 family protein n=1 Tax=Kordiimonas sp. SCSIO 12610 TaxID=2829597 RepID=UPI00210C956E|nr:cytochrome P460 family protein [Kordiimonas sp. SCSIO 12610]UTW56345.1 cytochrome P460 family protein [Kordiimonas sp. SCSIO 12610]